MKHLTSLRDYLATLDALGDLRVIDREVEADLEIGAFARHTTETRGPAVLFDRVRGYRAGFRVLGGPASLSTVPGAPYARCAIALGLDPATPPLQIMDGLTAAQDAAPVPPVVLDSGPCQDNVLLGDQADLDTFPIPLLHHGDGGSYVNTFGTFVLRSPDRSWTNWSIARAMKIDAHRMTGLILPVQHNGMIRELWREQGEPMPFALVQGAEPAVPFISGMALPEHVNEADYLGAYFGEPLQLVRCKTVDLEVPATAEIVIEGHVSLTEMAPEGPVGEYAGYVTTAPELRPVYHITAITHRNAPILPIVCAGKPVDEDHSLVALVNSAMWMHHLRAAGLPVTATWLIPESAIHIMAITVPRDWKQRSGATTSAAFCRAILDACLTYPRVACWLSRLMIIDDDIDPTDLRDVLWAFATRSHPTHGVIPVDDVPILPLQVCYSAVERSTATGSKSIFDCLLPDGTGRPRSTAFADNYPSETRHRVLDTWRSSAPAPGDDRVRPVKE
ncbi:3-octaprenyl-4-hydroxybenzoate carboxy-lyase (plasmid) [Streptomyces sp. YIM 121038]|uniref:UbiD family decarboxylase n=1 Tax=Streptomyces sp. YIM 121038 TaxID=2136401 RepID=UPI001110EFE8|nr:UbiD family decarboxylase [Streptomyces sp. YIM 121038]QCX82711.1 3-octaprenyl-4-hydroxybenzoate carboxy-lyase [Streptomyces sp. YIM 121038]